MTSGGYSPTLETPVAMGYVTIEHSKPGTPVNLMVRGEPHPGRVVDLPFVEHRYFKG